jgi:hypothetical protein
MGLMVTGDCLGKRERSGEFDDGKKWNVSEVMILDGVEVVAVRIERLIGEVPGRGEFVALAVEQRNGKLHAVNRCPEVEAVLGA